MRQFEENLFKQGIKNIAGVDEVGRGPLAGPVLAAAVIVPRLYQFKEKIRDSKKLSPQQRQKAFIEITRVCSYAYALNSVQNIDKYNILKASLMAMASAVNRLNLNPEWVLVDGMYKPEIKLPCTAIIAGDAKSISIASASIVAKIIRDNLMEQYDKIYPVYGFAKNKGYGTKEHKQALSKYGHCAIHRKTFQPIKSML